MAEFFDGFEGFESTFLLNLFAFFYGEYLCSKVKLNSIAGVYAHCILCVYCVLMIIMEH